MGGFSQDWITEVWRGGGWEVYPGPAAPVFGGVCKNERFGKAPHPYKSEAHRPLLIIFKPLAYDFFGP